MIGFRNFRFDIFVVALSA